MSGQSYRKEQNWMDPTVSMSSMGMDGFERTYGNAAELSSMDSQNEATGLAGMLPMDNLPLPSTKSILEAFVPASTCEVDLNGNEQDGFEGANLQCGYDSDLVEGSDARFLSHSAEVGEGPNGFKGVRAGGTIAGLNSDPAAKGESGFWGGLNLGDVNAGISGDENGLEIGATADGINGSGGYRQVNPDSDSDWGFKIGGSAGWGASYRTHHSDADQDGVPETGFGIDAGAYSFDWVREDSMQGLAQEGSKNELGRDSEYPGMNSKDAHDQATLDAFDPSYYPGKHADERAAQETRAANEGEHDAWMNYFNDCTETHPALNEASCHQQPAPELPGAPVIQSVGFAGGLLLGSQVKDPRHLHLHTVGQLVTLHARGQFLMTRMTRRVQGIKPGQQVQAAPLRLSPRDAAR